MNQLLGRYGEMLKTKSMWSDLIENERNGIIFIRVCPRDHLLLLGGRKGIQMYEMESFVKYNKISQHRTRNVYAAEYFSKLVAFVGDEQSDELKVFNPVKNTELCTQRYSSSICGIKSSPKYVIVALTSTVYIHDVRNMKLLRIIPTRWCGNIVSSSLAFSEEGHLVAFPDNSNMGSVVRLCDVTTNDDGSTFTTFEQTISIISLNKDGSLVAVGYYEDHSFFVYTNTGERIHQLRRSLTSSLKLQSILFSPDSRFVALLTESSSLHVFKLEKDKEQGLMDTLLLNWQSPYVTFRLSACGASGSCQIKEVDGSLFVLAATAGDFVDVFYLDTENPALCKPVQRRRVRMPSAEFEEKTSLGEKALLPRFQPRQGNFARYESCTVVDKSTVERDSVHVLDVHHTTEL